MPYLGGFNDTLARTVGAKLQAAWGQPVVIDNKPGGATVIGLDAAASRRPTATLVILPFSFAVNPAIFAKLPYDSLKDFSADHAGRHAGQPAGGAGLVAVQLDEGPARAGPLQAGRHELSASTGIGSSNHLSMEKFKQMAGVDITHVPYEQRAGGDRPDRRPGAGDVRQRLQRAAAR